MDTSILKMNSNCSFIQLQTIIATITAIVVIIAIIIVKDMKEMKKIKCQILRDRWEVYL